MSPITRNRSVTYQVELGSATAATQDLAATGFGDADSAAKMLGKALNDPIAGMTALGKAGVTFSDQQKEQIKTLVKTGDVLGAQKLIMQEVESQVGGAAEVAADPMQKLGAWDVIQNVSKFAWENACPGTS